jgi:hypothetical protein
MPAGLSRTGSVKTLNRWEMKNAGFGNCNILPIQQKKENEHFYWIRDEF